MTSNIYYETIAGYKLTEDPELNRELYGLTDEVAQIQQELYPDVIKGKKSAMRRLNKLCARYPRIPQFKNYLQMAYAAAGTDHKVREMTRLILDEHPDYLFGKITLANQYIEDGFIEKVPEVFGADLELRTLYPDREIFHIVELLAYSRTVVNYYLACDEPGKAQERIDIMEQIDPDDDKTVEARMRMMRYNLESSRKRFEEDDKIRRRVASRSYDKSVQTDRPPVFTHPEIEKLYSSGLDIDHVVLREILALPRETLVRDLEAVLQDSIQRFEYYREKFEDAGWMEERQNFNLHALMLLGELNSESSLPAVLHLLRQGEEFLDFWYGELLNRVTGFALFRIARNELETLKLFLKEPDNYLHARLSVTEAIKLIGVQHPERRKEVESVYQDLFRFVLGHLEDDRIIDSDLISFWIWDCMDLQLKELAGLIEELYRNRLVLPTICGTWDEVIRELHAPTSPAAPRPEETLFDVYNSLNSEEDVDLTKEVDDFIDNMSEHQMMKDMYMDRGGLLDELPAGDYSGGRYEDDYAAPQEEETVEKVGRNDPCPCGSGKKFKKCCL